MVVLIFLLSIFLVFPLIFVIENAEKDSVNLRLCFDPNFYKTNIFCLDLKKRKVLIKFVGYLLVVFLVFLTLYKFYFFNIKTFFDFTIILIFFIAGVIDIKFRIVPNFIFVALLIIGLFFSFLNPYIFYDKFWIISVLGGGIALSVSLLIYFLGNFIFKKEAIGMGDIKLFFCIGLLFGTKGFLFIFFYSFLSSAIFGIFYLIFKNKKADSYIPFVPFISFATYLFMYLRDYLKF
jgi:prepilin signal peptidase PulO-like enzyme (type II secretory pathway)